jgi:aspartyl-tRNA(Asn)/glutamyl-tRNA(Gln) amidotransferase subunit C
MAGITIEELEHVARLARLSFSSDELSAFTGQLNDILGYVAKLEELDTGGVTPTTHALQVTNVFRQDEVKPSLPVEEAVANAPEEENGAFVVPRII